VEGVVMLYYKEKTIKVAGDDFNLTHISDENHHNIATLYGKVRKPQSGFDKLHNVIDVIDADGRLIGMFWECVNEQESKETVNNKTP